MTTAHAAFAQPSLPYTPGADVRHAIALLVDDADMPLTVGTWPLPAGAVRHALSSLPAVLAPRLERARAVVSADLDRLQRGQISVTLANRADVLLGYGDDFTPASGLRLRGDALQAAGDTALPVVARLGARLDADPAASDQRRQGLRARLDDSAVAVQALGVQLQAGTRSAWWGPGWRSSLILGNNAPDLASVSLQRASVQPSASPLLSWLGPWSAEFFVAQSETDTEPAYAWLVGQRLTARPVAGWEIGLSRMAQWGARGRPKTARNFVDMLIGSGTNPSTQAGVAQDPGNQLAGFDVRARCPSGWPCAASVQWIGEDLAHGFPTHWLTQYGVEFWSDHSRLIVEYADTACDSSPNDSHRDVGCAYRNFVYSNGYASLGRWIGASQGPDVRLLSLHWLDDESGTSARADVGLLSARPVAAPVYFHDAGPFVDGKLAALTLQGKLAWLDGALAPRLRWQQVSAGGQRLRSTSLGAQWSRPLDGSGRSSGGATAWMSDHPAPLALAALGLGLALDRPADRYAQDHGSNPSMKALRRVGDLTPMLALGLAGTNWLFERGSLAGDTAMAATTAGLGAYAGSKVLKSAIARDRPVEGLGPDSFGRSGSPRSDSSMPSNHAAMAWAVVTPYAQAYGQDWLYGLAALTSVGRVMGREHWASDVVVGSLLGYHLGSWSRAHLADGARLNIVGRSVSLSLALP